MKRPDLPSKEAKMYEYILPARRYASAGNSDRNVSVGPSLTRRGIAPKRRKLAA